MYGFTKNLELYAKESIIPKYTDFTYNLNGEIDTIEYSYKKRNKETELEEKVLFLKLIFSYDITTGKVSRIERLDFPLDDKYR